MILYATITEGGVTLGVMVDYNHRTRTVDKIKRCSISEKGATINAGDLLTKHFEPCLNQLVDNVDWEEVRRAQAATEV